MFALTMSWALSRLATEQPAALARGIEEAELAPYLSTSYAPEPDLFIRTGGEVRISNFLLWQAAYAELVFSDCLWPEFDDAELDAALAEYARRRGCRHPRSGGRGARIRPALHRARRRRTRARGSR